MKRIIIFTLVCCLLFGTQAQAVTSKRLKASGVYEMNNMYSGKKEMINYGFYESSKKQTRKAIKLYKKSPLKFYKKYRKNFYMKYGAIKTRFKNNIFTFWGRTKYKGYGVKKKYKLWKYKLKISRNVEIYGNSANGQYLEKGTRKDVKRLLKSPEGLEFKFYVSNGVVYKIYALS